jgi:hypothetical protein
MTRADAALLLDRALERARSRTSRPVNGIVVDDLEADAILHQAAIADTGHSALPGCGTRRERRQ